MTYWQKDVINNTVYEGPNWKYPCEGPHWKKATLQGLHWEILCL